MSATPLPQSVVVRKAVTRDARYEGVLGSEQLPQFSKILVGPDAAHIVLQFGRDEAGRQILTVRMEARVRLQCQRCLGFFETSLIGDSRLALVLTDEQARALPQDYEPWLVDDDIDLWSVAGEELALAMPPVAYHPADECEAPAHSAGAPEVEPAATGPDDNPFGVLSTLLDGGDTKE
ncbi:MAG: YceD family protein [Halieaceae bacterium]|jgi:uncharacterized protein|nr:YceD family protein [Halieaceae bacterium]